MAQQLGTLDILQEKQTKFPLPTSASLKSPVTPAPENPVPSSGIHGHARICMINKIIKINNEICVIC